MQLPGGRRDPVAPVVDAAGLTLVAVAVGWTLVSARANAGSRPVPTVLALVLLPFAVAGGRAARHHLAGAATAVGALLALAGLLLGLGVTLRPFDPASAPLRYGNANGALFGLVALAVAAVLVATPAAQRSAQRPQSRRARHPLAVCGRWHRYSRSDRPQTCCGGHPSHPRPRRAATAR